MLDNNENKKPFVTIIVPAYKQEKSIYRDLLNIYETMSQTRWEFEIVVVVDGLVDNTYGEAKRVDKPNVLVYGYEENKGKGFAIRYGMEKSRGDLVAFIDAGMDIDPNGISMVLEHMEWYGADIIVGSKRHPVSKINYPFIRRFYSSCYYSMVRLLFGVKLSDTQTGLKVFRRNVIAAVLPRLTVKEFAFDIEILSVASRLGFTKIFEAPVQIHWYKDNTTFTPFLVFDRHIRYMLYDTAAIFYRMNFLRYYDDENKDGWIKMEPVTPIYNERYQSQPFFSIIIPVRKVNDYIKESLNYIRALKYPNYEVLVVVDSKEDSDPQDEKVRYLESGPVGPGEKRNMGAKEAKGDILAFIDDDAYPVPDWLNQAKSSFSRSEIYAVGGPAVTPPKASLSESVSGRVIESWFISGTTYYRYFPDRKRYVDDFPSVNLFVRREKFLSVGGFPAKYWPGEDTKLCLDLVSSSKIGIMYEPKMIVYHHRRNIFFPLFQQISKYGRHRGQFARIFPKTSRRPFYFIPTFFVLGLVLGPILSTMLPILWLPFYICIALYLALLGIETLRAGYLERNIKAGILFAIAAFETHVIYGVSFLYGLIQQPKLTLRKINQKTGNYL